MKPEHIERIDDAMRSRQIALEKALDAATAGDGIAGAMFALESLCEPYYLGLDSDPDDSNLEVWP